MYLSDFAEIEVCYWPYIEVFVPAPAPPVCAPKGTKIKNFEKFSEIFFFFQIFKKTKMTKCLIWVHVWSGRSGMLKPYLW